MRIRLLPTAVAVLAAPMLLAGCGSSGSVEEFCAVFQQVDEAEDTEEGLPLLDDLEDAAPTDRLKESVGVAQEYFEQAAEADENGEQFEETEESREALEFVQAYADQNCSLD
ncbi:hypothetical protein ACI8AA_06915 [Geodermatophilus sp. SYSU D01180]